MADAVVRRHGGATLIELMLVLSLASVLALAGSAGWHAYMVRVRQAEARLALMHNARHLERLHAKNDGYSKPPRQGHGWVTPAVTSTGYYTIKFSAEKKENIPGRYRLEARPKFLWLGKHFLRMDQDGLIVTCCCVEDKFGRERCSL